LHILFVLFLSRRLMGSWVALDRPKPIFETIVSRLAGESWLKLAGCAPQTAWVIRLF